MPGFYKPGEYDLAGFATGVVDKKKQLRPKETIEAGDIVLGLPSSGLHANGYSLVRQVFAENEWEEWGDDLLKPTRLYVRSVLPVLDKMNQGKKWGIRGLVHVTGGGFTDNIPRILPEDLQARITMGSWTIPPIFKEIQKRAKISDEEMFRTFNMGMGLILTVDSSAVGTVRRYLRDARVIGKIEEGPRGVRYAELA
jgi:phosphoribosylformylglycinamidine cyclo-ligase